VNIRKPSRAHPFSQLLHARTAEHVAHEFGLSESAADIRQYWRLMKAYPVLKSSSGVAPSVRAAHAAKKALAQIEKELAAQSRVKRPRRRSAVAPTVHSSHLVSFITPKTPSLALPSSK